MNYKYYTLKAVRFIVVFVVCLFAVSCSKKRTIVDESLMRANAEALKQSIDMSDKTADIDKYIQFDKTEIKFGDMELGQTRKAIVKAKNISDAPLVILNAVTSCSCTKVAYSKKPIAAGESIDLEVSFTAEVEGVFFKKIAVTHSATTRPVSFSIGGIVKPRKKKE